MMDEQMSKYQPITRPLRKKLEEYKPMEVNHAMVAHPIGATGYERLMELCDTIDAIHEGLEEASDRLRAERDSMAAALDRAEGEHHAYAPESHYMMLPKDADGEPIHVGDVMEWPDGEKFEVVGIGGNTLFYIKDGLAEWVDARNKRHHSPDTWERIIEDAREYMLNIGGSYLWKNKSDELVDRCKALAGDGTGGSNEHH